MFYEVKTFKVSSSGTASLPLFVDVVPMNLLLITVQETD